MICDKCHDKIATVMITQIVGDSVVKLYLCEKCSNENGELNKQNDNSFEYFLSGLLNAKSTSLKNEQLKCENCGMTIDSFKVNSKVGCAHCYSTFSQYFESLIKRIHANTEHTGKRPEKLVVKSEDLQKLEELKKKLKAAILEEEYELAACLRDEIKALSKEV